MLPWTRSKWFRLGVTGLSTLFVGVVLATALMAEGSALKRAEIQYDAIDCKKDANAKGRARPAKGCKRKKRVVIPIKDGAAVSKEDLERALDEMPRLQGPRGLAGPRGERGSDGKDGPRGERGPAGEGKQGEFGKDGSDGQPGKDGAAGRQGDRKSVV